MSTFFSTSFKPQPHIRQEGFHLDNEGTGGGLTATGEHHEGSGATPPPFDFGRNNVMDFTDELASLMGAASPHPGHQSHHGGHDGLSHSHHESHIHGHSGSHHESHLHGLHHHDHHGHHQHNQSHERSTHSPSDDVSGSYRTTHNIFDMGVGNPVAVSPSTTTTSATTATSHFNSTVPPLNSSMRFEQPSQHDYHHSAHTPSPPLGGKEPSRSRSRPPTGSASGGVGPQRTTRSRRNNSISSTSPPPHIRPAAQAIVIPGVRHTNGSLASPLSSSATSVTNPWGFASSSPTGTSTSEFTLPTPDSLHHHHHSNSLSHSMHTPHLSTSVGFGGYFGSEFGGYGGHGGQHNGGHTPSTSLPVSGTIHSHLGGAGGGAGSGGHGHGHGHHRTNSAAASTTAGSASGGGSATSATTMTTQEKQAMAASEKRRRRRESHNAVERRRRDNINEKISELATLIPESLLEGGSLPPASGGPQNILPAPGSNGGDSPSGTDLLSPTSPTADSDLWSAPLITMKKEDVLDSGLGGLESPILPSGGIGGANTTTGNGNGNNGNGNAAGVVKANKGMILRKSVEYIRYLQQVVQEQDNRNRQLEMELRGYKERNGEPISPTIPAPAFDFQTNGVLGSGSNGSSGAYHGAGYGGSFRMLDSMPEDEAEPNTCGQKSVTTNKSRESTPLTEDEEPVDDDDPNDPDVQPPASLKKGGIGATKRATRGRKAASGNGSAAGSKTRTKSKKANEEDVDMAGSDEEGAAMEV